MLSTATRRDEPHSKGTDLSARVAAMALIFCVSLFAVSFPALSKRIRYIHIPPVVFFIGKHFGTGVILSTAFVHLLQDAFDRLQDPDVKRYTNIGHWAGLIVLSSLLAIFLVEYISTAYVDHLHSYSSLPSTPKVEPAQLPPISSAPSLQVPSEVTPLLDPCPSAQPKQPRRHTVAGAHGHGHSHGLLPGHHRHEPHKQHDHHHSDHPRYAPTRFYESADGEGGASAKASHVEDHQVDEPQHSPRYQVHPHSHGHGHHGHGDLEGLIEGAGSDADTECTTEEEEAERTIGRKRQIVGILVLQLGIMLHSLVIGFTLALASGVDFESLVMAISFHQLFEGLSLGIRIAALPAHPDPQQSSLGWLRPLLSLLFAITTPAGILSGLVVFDAGHRGGDVGAKVAEGVLSAVSAGMLIYAACVEMLAADFVLDPTLWRASKGRQVLALASVGMGAAGMVLLEYVFPLVTI